MTEEPIFRIVLAHGRAIEIWATGRVEGVVGKYQITNNIHEKLLEAHQAGWEEGKRWGAEHGSQPSMFVDVDIDINKLKPCGECHLKPGVTCDICGRTARAD